MPGYRPPSNVATPRHLGSVRCRSASHMTFGGRPERPSSEPLEIRVLRHDCQPLGRRVCPHHRVVCGRQAYHQYLRPTRETPLPAAPGPPRLLVKRADSCGWPRYEACGIGRARSDVVSSQFREIGKQLRDGHAAREVFQHIAHRDAHTADARLPAALFRLDRDQMRVVHIQSLAAPRHAVNDTGRPTARPTALRPTRIRRPQCGG